MHLEVAAAVIFDEHARIFCVQRGASKFASTANRWEFPGGKLEPGELPAQAAVREVQEELGITVEAVSLGPTIHHVYPEFEITLHTVLCQYLGGEVTLREHLAQDWCPADALVHHTFAAADLEILAFLRERAFGAALRTKCFGRHATFISQCASTNDVLLEQAQAGAPEGALVVTEVQHAGRGRLGRTWLSSPGQGLIFSMLVRPKLPPEIAATVTLLAGVAMVETLRQKYGVSAGLKWPNDVLIDQKKLCGILCEAQSSSRGIEGIVIGVGLNVSAVPESVAYRATALDQAVDRCALLADFCACFESLYARWQVEGLRAVRTELLAADCKLNQPISIKQADETLQGVSRGIREDGALLLERTDGSITPILCGEIEQWA